MPVRMLRIKLPLISQVKSMKQGLTISLEIKLRISHPHNIPLENLQKILLTDEGPVSCFHKNLAFGANVIISCRVST